MATEKALYWIALGVMAVGLGNSFMNHHQDFARNLGQHAMLIADSVSGRAAGQMDHAQVMFDRTQASFDRSQAEIARVQTRAACLQNRIAVRQAALAEAQAMRTRMSVARSVRKIVVTVPELPANPVVVNGWDSAEQ